MLILHGENLVASRQFLTEKIKSFKGEVIRLEEDQLNLTQFKQALESASLFGQDRLVVLENIFSQRPSQKKEKILNYYKENQFENLIIWEKKTIDGRSLRAFAAAKIIRFKIPPAIFNFLDSLNPNNKKIALNYFHLCLKQDTPEMIFYMLANRIRDLIIAADLGIKGFPKMPFWQKNKIISQAKKFKLKRLLVLYQQLLKIDISQKTGQASLPLASQLDLLLASF